MRNQYLPTIIFVNIVSELRLNSLWCSIYGLIKNKTHSVVPVNKKNSKKLATYKFEKFYFMKWTINLVKKYYTV